MLASAWLHDIGMLKYVYILIHRDENAVHSQIRKLHHITTAQYIVEYWNTLKIDEDDKELLAKLCFFHRLREDLNDCDKYFYLRNSRYKLRLLAAYLRLADAFDICSTRVSSESYAICLAYNIPDESKLHWIKSRIVNGIFLDNNEHKIYVQFKIPRISNIEDKLSLTRAEEKLNSIIKIVINDLRSELSSVMNVLAREKAYYLDIEVLRSEVTFDEQMLADLREIVINYDIMMAPSASKLLDIILVTFANLIGFSLSKHQDYRQIRFSSIVEIKNIRPKLMNFIEILKRDILSARPCHLGLRNLIESLEKYIEKSKSTDELIRDLSEEYKNHHQARSDIRELSNKFFEEKTQETKRVYNILLYGYSELVVKALCGLRNALIIREFGCVDPKDIYNSTIEKRYSEQIQIFICDGQPKTQTGFMDRLVYHDASQYALFLKERGFSNITIIPDIIAGTIMKCVNIDFIMVGANGITDKYFIHSAGHFSLIKLAKSMTESDSEPKVILVTTTEKKLSKLDEYDPTSHLGKELQEVEGVKVKKIDGCGPNRQHIWMVKDKALIDKLYQANILFANPREDKIEIQEIDYIITEKKYCVSNEWAEFFNRL